MIIAVATIHRKRKHIVNGPDVLTRGFVYGKESDGFMDDVKQVCMEAIQKGGSRNLASKKNRIKETMRNYIYQKTKRTPMIIPIIVEI